MPEVMNLETTEEVTAEMNALPVENTERHSFKVELRERQGRVEIRCQTSQPIGDDDFVGLFTSAPPLNVKKAKSPSEDFFRVKNAKSKLTKKNWGSGYYVAYYRENSPGSMKYRRQVSAGPTRNP